MDGHRQNQESHILTLPLHLPKNQHEDDDSEEDEEPQNFTSEELEREIYDRSEMLSYDDQRHTIDEQVLDDASENDNLVQQQQQNHGDSHILPTNPFHHHSTTSLQDIKMSGDSELRDVIKPLETIVVQQPTTTVNVESSLQPPENTQSEKVEEVRPRKRRRLRYKSVKAHTKRYMKKWSGVPKQENLYRRPPLWYMIVAFIASFTGIAIVCVIHYYAMDNYHPNSNKKEQLGMVIGSFGASAVLIYGELKSPLAQPRNFVGGHLFSSIVGVIIKLVLTYTGKAQEWLQPWACALSVATAIFVMHLTRTTHPPGGATALIAVISPLYPWYGFQYVFMPVLAGCFIMLTIALIVNNIRPSNSYPLYWI